MIDGKKIAGRILGFILLFACVGCTGIKTGTAVFEAGSFPFEEVPSAYRLPCESVGTVERIEYPTHTYGRDGSIVLSGTNEAYVYLPYGYDDRKEYNVLYLMHGGEENAGYWFAQGEYGQGGRKDRSQESVTLNVLDQMIARGDCAPLIVVTPCLATDGTHGFNDVSTFRYEFKRDLVPAIEGRYATFACGDVSPENLTKTREHRAYAGLSLGSAAGWSSILMDCLDYVGYVGNFSGCYANVYAVAEAINTVYCDYPILYWYNGNGTLDSSQKNHERAYHQMLRLCEDRLNEGLDTTAGQNCCFVNKEGKYHRYDSWIADLFNVLLLFFK